MAPAKKMVQSNIQVHPGVFRPQVKTSRLCTTCHANLEVLSFTKKKSMEQLKSCLQDWILGPKPVEVDSEEGRAEMEEEHRLSICSTLLERDELQMEKEKDGPLPGFHQGDAGCHQPAVPPPLRSSISASYPGEKRMSIHSVTFSCPVTPYATSL
uniref:Uncharacterized protein n=1 Tax=Gasterosteus aculeatus TaxID=69293 RepID=G3PQX5_GASAC